MTFHSEPIFWRWTWGDVSKVIEPIMARVARFRAMKVARHAKDAEIRHLRGLSPYQLAEIGIDRDVLMSDMPDIKPAIESSRGDRPGDPVCSDMVRGHLIVAAGRPQLI